MESFSDSSVYRVPGCRRKSLQTAVLIYRSALNGSVPGAEENPLWMLVSISDHWICSGPGEIPDGEPWQPAVPAAGILHRPELPQPCPAPIWRDTDGTWGAHPSQSIQLSRHVLSAMRCCTKEDRHVKINSASPEQHCPEPQVMAPGHCSSLSSNKQPVLASGKGDKP